MFEDSKQYVVFTTTNWTSKTSPEGGKKLFYDNIRRVSISNGVLILHGLDDEVVDVWNKDQWLRCSRRDQNSSLEGWDNESEQKSKTLFVE
jgi:hypothetical protein